MWWRIPTTFGPSRVHGPCTIVQKCGDHIYQIKADEKENEIDKQVPLQQICPYSDSAEGIDRTNIAFATPEPDTSRISILKKPLSELEPSDLILGQRGRVTTDVYEYDLARIISNDPRIEMVTAELLSLNDDGKRWNDTGLRFSFP